MRRRRRRRRRRRGVGGDCPIIFFMGAHPGVVVPEKSSDQKRTKGQFHPKLFL